MIENDDLLWRQLKTIPAFRALLRAIESRFYRHLELPGPVLDVGCGDGHFAQMTFDHPLDVGIDPWWGPLRKAQRSGAYRLVLQGLGDRLPFPDHTFASVISNSVLEHIPDVQPVLNEISRVLKPNGRLVITMPSHYFTQNLGGAAFCNSLGLPELADRYRWLFNRIARHAHTDTAEVWAQRLAQAGFVVERWQYYFSPGALRALEWGHAQGLPAAVLHALTGHWIVAPWESSLRRTEQWLRPFFHEEAPENGAYVLFVARKAADGPVEVNLPAARPFTLAELEQEIAQEQETGRKIEIAPEPERGQEYETAIEIEQATALETKREAGRALAREQTEEKAERQRQTAGMVGVALLALLFATLGVLNLHGGEANWRGALTQFALSALFLWLLQRWQGEENSHFRARFHLPRLPHLPRQWLLLLPALLLSTLSFSSSGAQRPLLALVFWVAAAGLALYALWPPAPGAPAQPAPDLSDSSLIALALFVLALLLRTINLTGLPFIINGIEALQGLEGLRAARGEWGTIFGSSWQGNPALPYFLLALPLELFGPTAVSVRLLSPLVGALTVVATFWLGQMVWGRQVGLAAALLLLGSHWHLHYSRLGLTVIWEPLWALLAVTLVSAAWQKQQDGKAWLLAGTAVGLSMNFMRHPLLLPLLLLLALALAALTARPALRAQGRNLAAALLLALVIALPQLLHQRSLPLSTWRQDSILNPQTNWLAQEAARTGQTETAVMQQQLWQGMLALNAPRDNSLSYRAQSSLLGFGAALLLALGVLTAVLSLPDARALLLLLWLGAGLLGEAALLPNPPQSDRLLLLTPTLALLGGLGLAKWLAILHKANVFNGRWATMLLIAIATLFTAGEIGYYYGRYPSENSFADRNTEIAHRIADYLNTLDGSWSVYFYGPPSMYVDFPTIPFLARSFQKGQNLFDVVPTEQAFLPVANTTNVALLFLPERAAEATALQTMYPGGQWRVFSGRFADPLFYSLEIRE